MKATPSPYVPLTCPLIDGVKYRYSVGYQEGEKRTVIAWFRSIQQAAEYAKTLNAGDLYRPSNPALFHYNVIAALE